MPTLLPGATILHGPLDWTVLQRDAAGAGALQVQVAGALEPWGPGAALQARLVEEATGAVVAPHLDWTDAQRDDGAWVVRLARIPTGGLYRLETRIRRPGHGPDARALRGDCRHHLAVGDIWVIAGQSNASGTGKGTAFDPPELGIHQFTNAERWALATHPLEDATDSRHPCTITTIFHGHSPWLAFARRMRARTGIPVGLVPCALGGSALARWITADHAPGDLTVNLLAMVQGAGGSVAGILWYQGESDVFDPTGAAVACYAERFAAWVQLVRQRLGHPTCPVLVGQLGACTLPDDTATTPASAATFAQRWVRLRQVQRRLAHRLVDVQVVPTVDLPLSDEIHHGAVANVAIGERFADRALMTWYGQASSGGWPEVISARWGDGAERRRVVVEVRGRSGDWTPVAACHDLCVHDADGPLPGRLVLVDGQQVEIELARRAGAGARLEVLGSLRPMPTLRDDAGKCLMPGTVDLPDVDDAVAGGS